MNQIRIFEYFWLEYSNIFGSNIRIFLVQIFESHFGQTFKYSIGADRSESLYSRTTMVTIMLLTLSKLFSVAKLIPAQSKFNPVAWAMHGACTDTTDVQTPSYIPFWNQLDKCSHLGVFWKRSEMIFEKKIFFHPRVPRLVFRLFVQKCFGWSQG